MFPNRPPAAAERQHAFEGVADSARHIDQDIAVEQERHDSLERYISRVDQGHARISHHRAPGVEHRAEHSRCLELTECAASRQ